MAAVTEEQVREQEKQLWKQPGDHIDLPEDDDEEENRGVIYVGRLPHGFYEAQLQGYFSQFGDITRLRLSRNKKVTIQQTDFRFHDRDN
jgi:RNA recognition motif-containing protein